MTSVGQTLMGLSLGVLCVPGRWSPVRKAGLLAAFVMLAELPDLSVLVVGNYNIRHSLAVNLAAAGVAFVVAALWLRRQPTRMAMTIAVFAMTAEMSHLLLDSFYNHGRGVGIGWPFGGLSLNLSLPWFQTLQPGGHFAAINLRTYFVELLFYGPLLAICIGIRLWWASRRRGRCVPPPSR